MGVSRTFILCATLLASSKQARMDIHLFSGMTFHINNVDIFVQLKSGTSFDDRMFNGDSVGIVEKGVGMSGLPPGCSLNLSA